MDETTGIIVAGGGIAGMIATLVFADAGHRTICVDPAQPPNGATPPDLRSTALLAPSVTLLRDVGLFDYLLPHATPLKIMRIVDAGGADNEVRQSVDFVAQETGVDEFGWNIPNSKLRETLLSAIAAHSSAELIHGETVDHLTPRLAETIARLSDGRRIRAKIAIAADGRDSHLREDAGIAAKRVHYGQKANVFTVTHDVPHGGISTEIHRSGGPFTLVPLAGEAEDRSAVVWMEHGSEAARLNALPDAAFIRAANLRSCGVQGTLKLVSDRALWPIIGQSAARLYGDRLALIAEAAHVVPPIGAQGLNMSLGDIAALRALFAEANDIGAPSLLEAYNRQRMADIHLRVQGIDLLNRISMADHHILRNLRGAGLRTIAETGLKKPLMALGLGLRG